MPKGFLFLVNASAGDTHNVHLVCADDSGEVRWIRACGEGRNLAGRGLQALARGGYAICGSGAAHLGQPDFYLASVTSEGGIIWQREWGGEGSQGLNAVAQDSAGDLVIAGWAQAAGREDADLYLAKTDSRGNVIWTRQIGGPDEERLSAVCLAQKGSIVAAGQRAADETVILLLKTDAQGQVLWQRAYKMEEQARVADVCATSDGGALVVSSFAPESYRPDECAAHALKVDAQGEPLWEQRYYLGPGCCDELRVRQESEGYMIAAFAIGCDTTRRSLQIVQLNRLGEALWRTFYSGNGFHRQGREHGYWFSRGADPLVQGLKVWFGESAGELRLSVRHPRLTGKRRDKWATLVAFELPRQSAVRLVLSDIHGRQAETLMEVNCSPGRHSLWWDATDRPNGIYVVQLQTSQGTLTEKYVVMK
jgi:outer membrane protein assembly factor BamB